VPNAGIVPVSKRYDTAGPMAKSVQDVADLLTVLVDSDKATPPIDGYAAAIGTRDSWSELKVGTLNAEEWFSRDEKMTKPVPDAEKQIVRSPRSHKSFD
jgi:amidase